MLHFDSSGHSQLLKAHLVLLLPHISSCPFAYSMSNSIIVSFSDLLFIIFFNYSLHTILHFFQAYNTAVRYFFNLQSDLPTKSGTLEFPMLYSTARCLF